MTKEIFQQMVIREFNRCYGEDYRLEIKLAYTANDICKDVIVIHQTKNSDSVADVAFDWEYFFESTEKMDYTVDMVGMVVKEIFYAMKKDIRVEDLLQWESVGKMLRIRVVNYEKSKRFLSDLPHRKYLDLAAVAYLDLGMEDTTSMLVRNSMLSAWGKAAKGVLDQAEDNMKKMCCIQENIIKRLLRLYQEVESSVDNIDPGILDCLGVDNSLEMYVVKYDSPAYGASAILNPANFSFLKQNVYIIASNCHELIVIPDNEILDENDMRLMVNEINRTDVLEEEVLSGNIYYYNYEENRISLVESGW